MTHHVMVPHLLSTPIFAIKIMDKRYHDVFQSHHFITHCYASNLCIVNSDTKGSSKVGSLVLGVLHKAESILTS